MAFERGLGRGWAIAGAAVVTIYVVASTPLRLTTYPYYEAHGLSVGHFLNRELRWSEDTIQTALVIMCLAALAVAVALRLVRFGSTAFRAVAGVAAAVVLVWGLTAEVYAAEGERHLSLDIEKHMLQPYDWVEQATGGRPVVVLGQGISDPTGIWLTEFFNPSIRKIWSLDGSARFVGAPILTPDLEASDGTLTPNPETDYALALNGVELQAPLVQQRVNDRLYRVDGKPLKLAAAITGQESDGWLIGTSEEPGTARGSYTRYDVSRDSPGFVVVKLSRNGWCPKPPKGTTATVRIGTVGIGPDKQPAIERVTGSQTKPVHDCTEAGFAFGTPRRPWRIEVEISPTVRPREVDPKSSESRPLGATMSVSLLAFNPG
jgi:hypothetical protein